MSKGAPAHSRYAIYFVPTADSALYRFGSALLGYDCYGASDVDFPAVLPMDRTAWRDVTSEPRRYGFHATLKAPFCLASGAAESELVEEFGRFARGSDRAPAFTPVVEALEGFIAIVPAARDPAIDGLAASCVTGFERFRAPLNDEDRRRRMAGLSERHVANLDRWGYPFVFDEFRLHLTLTGRLPAERRGAVLSALRKEFVAACGARSVRIDRLALLRQDRPDGRFRVIDHAAIGAG
jgi:Protein of unknown function (DUF1045)